MARRLAGSSLLNGLATSALLAVVDDALEISGLHIAVLVDRRLSLGQRSGGKLALASSQLGGDLLAVHCMIIAHLVVADGVLLQRLVVCHHRGLLDGESVHITGFVD